MAIDPLDVDQECRPYFPSLHDGFIFADNAGGTQVLKDVAERVYDYMVHSSAQTGAYYPSSLLASKRTSGHPQESAVTLFNAASVEEISFGSSTTMLAENLARAIEADCLPGEEIVVSVHDHEANVGPWVRLAARRGLKLVEWRMKPVSAESSLHVALDAKDLEDLISSKTRLVAFAACSNITGEIVDVQSIVADIRRFAAERATRKLQICVDCVALAPHRRIDVQAWDVDFAQISYYKMFGPHNAVLYTRLEARNTSLTPLCHFFLDRKKVEPNGPGYELTWGTTAVVPYFLGLGGGSTDSEKLDRCFARIAAHDEELMRPLIELLLSKKHKGVRIVGPESWQKDVRVPTISFVVLNEDGKTKRLLSRDVAAKFDEAGNVGIRNGNSYSFRLMEHLDFDPADGVVRISLVHYNTVEEVQRIIDILADIL